MFTASMLKECVEVDQMGSAMGLAVTLMHGTPAISSAIMGVLRQLTGDYATVICFGATIYLSGVFAFLLVYAFNKVKKSSPAQRCHCY